MRLFKKKCKRNTLILTVDGLISRWAYIQNKIFVGKWMGLYPGGGGGLKVGFYGIDIIKLINYVIIHTHTVLQLIFIFS